MVILSIWHTILEAIRDFFFFFGQDRNWIIALVLVAVFVALRVIVKKPSPTVDTPETKKDFDKPMLEESPAGQLFGIIVIIGLIVLVIFITEKGCS